MNIKNPTVYQNTTDHKNVADMEDLVRICQQETGDELSRRHSLATNTQIIMKYHQSIELIFFAIIQVKD